MSGKRPAGLGVKGRAMWDELAEHLGASHRAVLEEACRTADRLDVLHDRLRRDPYDFEAQTQARASASALRLLVREVTDAAGESKPEVKPSGVSTSDDLARRRTERRAKAALSVGSDL